MDFLFVSNNQYLKKKLKKIKKNKCKIKIIFKKIESISFFTFKFIFDNHLYY